MNTIFAHIIPNIQLLVSQSVNLLKKRDMHPWDQEPTVKASNNSAILLSKKCWGYDKGHLLVEIAPSVESQNVLKC